MDRPTILIVDDEEEIIKSLSTILEEGFHILNKAKSTMLTVDDEDQFRESLSEALEEEFHVLAASNVRKGLSIIDENYQNNRICFFLVISECSNLAAMG